MDSVVEGKCPLLVLRLSYFHRPLCREDMTLFGTEELWREWREELKAVEVDV
jgi:hypothetical protein